MGDCMKFRSICEDHLYRKAYAKGKRFVTPALAVYVLPDYRANVLMKAHPRKLKVNRIGLTVQEDRRCRDTFARAPYPA